MVVSASLTARAGTLGGWLGVSPASFTQGVGTELRREVIGSDTVTLNQPSEQSPFFHYLVMGYENLLGVQSPWGTVRAGNILRNPSQPLHIRDEKTKNPVKLGHARVTS